MGIEPTSEAWEAPVLPLNYARSLFLIVLVNCLWSSVRLIHVAIQLTGANRNDSQQALLVDAIPPLQGVLGRPRHRPDYVLGDRGYDAESLWQGLRDRGIVPLLAMRNTEHGSGLGRW
jgi:hypothetical protein